MGKIITESIVAGYDLFASGADDGFEIISGGMPNGNNSLRVRGDLSQDIRAFADVSGTSPDISSPTFLQGETGTIILWLKLGSLGGSDLGTASTANSILTVQNVDSVLQNVIQQTSSTVTGSWKICAGGVDGLTVIFGTSWKSSGGTKQYRGAAGTAVVDTWTMFAFVGTSGTGHLCSVNGGTYGGALGTSNSTSTGASNASFLSIGSYSQEAGVGARPGSWEIGKISFHDTKLDEATLSTLYASMTA